MAQLNLNSDSERLVQSMLQKLRLQEQRSEQASTTSEDLTNTTIEDVEYNDTLASDESDNQHAPHTKWPGLSPFFRGTPKTFGNRKGPTGQKDNVSFSDMNGEIPKWERKQLRFSLVSSLIAEKEEAVIDVAEPLNHETHASPASEIKVGPGSPEIEIKSNTDWEGNGAKCDDISSQLTPDPVHEANVAVDSPIWESITYEDNVSSSTDSLSRNSQPVDKVVTSKTSNHVRKNKRKWAETKTTKRFAQKIKEKWRDRHQSTEKKHNRNEENFEEKVHQVKTGEQVSSSESGEVKENTVAPPPIRQAGSEVTPCPQGYDSMSLSGFDIGFSSSLMDEICTGPEWTIFFASGNILKEVPEGPDEELEDVMQSPNAVSLPDSMQENGTTEAMVQGIDEIALHDNQGVDSETGNGFAQPTTSEQVSHNHQGTIKVISNQGGTTELRSNDSQMTTDSLDQSNMYTFNDDQSDTEFVSNTDDIMEQQTYVTEPEQISASYISPHQIEVTTPNPDPSNESYKNPHQTKIPSPNLDEDTTSEIQMTSLDLTEDTIDMYPQLPPATQADDELDYGPEESQIPEPTLILPDTVELINPYLTQSDDESETEDTTPDQSSQNTEPTIYSSPGEGDRKVPQFLPLLDLSDVKGGDEEWQCSAGEKKRRALQSEERETFIDEDDDGNIPAKSHRNSPLTPPPFHPPPPPFHLITQRSISLDSDSSLAEVVPKKRRLESTPRRVRFAEEVVMLPSYVQTEVEDWPEPEGSEEDTDELEDSEDMEDMEDTAVTEEISAAKEAAEKTPEVQLSIYNWILGITKKNKRKAQI